MAHRNRDLGYGRHFPLAPSLRAAGSPHLVPSTQIFLGDLSASVGIPGRPNSVAAAGASPGTALNRGSLGIWAQALILCRVVYYRNSQEMGKH